MEHQAHAQGHAGLVVEGARVLVAGDMLSDIFIPLLHLSASNPIGDYLEGLRRLEAPAEGVAVVVPGHGSVGDADELRRRIDLDRTDVEALRDGRDPNDPRVGPSATFGREWLPAVDEWQRQQLAERAGGAAPTE